MKYRQITTRINMILFGLVLFGCANKKPPNEYIFSEPTAEWYVIINGCKNGKNFIEGKKRRFVFPENGILLANMKDFEITKNDVFLMEGKSFDPNSEERNSYKLCYYTSSLNSGYNVEYLSKELNIPSLGNDVKPIQNFDFYFFRVDKSCDDKVKKGSELFDSIYIYLLKNKVLSVK